MLSEKVITLINAQINKEFYSAYLYLDISNYYFDANLNGFGNWFRVQAQEERDHAMLFTQYLQNNGAKVVLEAIAKPDYNFQNFREALVESLVHEQYVTSSINEIYDAAHTEKDFRTMQFLDWFVKEQGEEEKNSDENIKKYDLFGSDPRGLYMLDSELATRVYAPPSLVI